MLTGKVAIVTGAGRGIGAATAKLLARQGASVVVNDVSKEPAEAVVAEINNAGGQALAFPGSVLEEDFPDTLMQLAATNPIFGKGSVDVLVNNAGFTWDGMLHKMSNEQWQSIIDMHATVPFKMIRAATPYMREIGKQEKSSGIDPADRCIINISSTSGLHGSIGQANYASGKTAILGLTRTVAKEWGSFGIRCNAVAYGWIDTRMTQAADEGEIETVVLANAIAASIPLARIGTPEEAAGGVLMMVSPHASYVTGTILEVTGGMGI
eukprot:GSMAST32.ASY1.ANO1.1350.1 assembled CDS